MKDIYKYKMLKYTDIGGLKCHCCNPSRGKLKNSHVGKDSFLNKLARRTLKLELKNKYDLYLNGDF